jgi:hypothetical protein
MGDDITETTVRRRRFSVWLFLRTLAGLLLAPIFGGALLIAGFNLFEMARSGGGPGDLPGSLAAGAFYGGVVGIPAALLLGWPVHLLLLHLRWTHVLVYVGLGGLIAAAAPYAWMLLGHLGGG